MSQTQPGEESASAWTQPRFILAGALVAVIAVLGILLAIIGPRGDDTGAEPGGRPAARTPTATTTASPAGGSVCGLPAGSQTVPATTPKTEWTLVGTVAAPGTEAAGPGSTKDGLRSCYARSPVGALYAAANFLATTSDPQLRLPAAEQLTAKGEGRDRALELLSGADPGGTAAGVQVAGFTFLNYSKAAAVVDLAVLADGKPVHLPISVRWEAQDWKVVLPPTGDAVAGIQPLPDLTGYVPWAGA